MWLVRFSCFKTINNYNGFTGICLTKLDVLDTFEKIKVCVDYNGNEPVIRSIDGWKKSIVGINNYDDLPDNAKKYIKDIESFLDIPIDKYQMDQVEKKI